MQPITSYLGVVDDFFEGFSALNGDEPRSVSFLFCRKLDSSASSSSESSDEIEIVFDLAWLGQKYYSEVE